MKMVNHLSPGGMTKKEKKEGKKHDPKILMLTGQLFYTPANRQPPLINITPQDSIIRFNKPYNRFNIEINFQPLFLPLLSSFQGVFFLLVGSLE